jgi:hypothetical protein
MGGLICSTLCNPVNLFTPKTYSITAQTSTNPTMTSDSSITAVQHSSDIQLESIGPDGPVRFKELLVQNASPLNLRIVAPDGERGLFFVNNTTFTLNKPHVTLHAGPDKLGPVLGVVYLGLTAANTVGIGDPDNNANSMVWESLSRTSKWTHSTYQFEFIFGEEGRKSFIWQRVQSNPFDDQGNLELYEDGNPGVLLAKYESVGVFKWKNRGKMYIVDGYGDGWELMVLLTCLGLIELSRRRARQRRH